MVAWRCYGGMNHTEWKTIRETSQETGLGESTIRRYIQYHELYIQIKRVARNRLFVSNESIPVIKKIANLYDQKMTRNEVEKLLRNQEIMTVVVTNNESNENTLTVKDYFVNTERHLMRLSEENMELKIHTMNMQKQLQSISDEILQRKKPNTIWKWLTRK